MPQLDGLRALAVLSVLIHHFLDPNLLPRLVALLPWGLAGVRLFFVLSGFLITSILIDARTGVTVGMESWGQAIRRFYVRRTLRIFPLYYLVLLITFLFGPADARQQLPWLATYTYNIWISSMGWFTDYFAHFWSLSVEEQFYLVWPWIILLAPRDRLTLIATVMIIIAPLYRWYAISNEWNGVAIYAFTLSSVDALGLGTVLSILSTSQALTSKTRRAFLYIAARIGIGGFIVLTAVQPWTGYTLIHGVLLETFLGLAFVWLIARASRGLGGAWMFILGNKPIVYLGKISYGIYVYHLFLLYLIPPLLAYWGISIAPRGWISLVVLSICTILVASISWHFIEAPINRLKGRFDPPRA
jgi:peptidoglycan/LPS O-acetylase OafA/YrhL